MIVCICNSVNSKTIKSAIDDGANSLNAIRSCTGAASSCGKCQFKVARLLSDSQKANAAVVPQAYEVMPKRA